MRIKGASMEQRAILDAIAYGLRPSAIEAVSIELHDVHGLQLCVTEPEVLGPRGHWETVLLANAFQDRATAARLDPVGWVAGPGFGQVLGMPRPIRPETLGRAGIRQRIESAAAATGALVDRLEIVEPFGLASAVSIAVADVHAFLRYALQAFLQLAGHGDQALDGSFVEVIDGEEEAAWTAGYSRYWGFGGARPDVRCCAPYRGAMTFDPGPPPCSAGMHTLDDMLARFRQTASERTGRSAEEWCELIPAEMGEVSQRVRWLQREHRLGQADAAAVATLR